jgi:hypothetical protein
MKWKTKSLRNSEEYWVWRWWRTNERVMCRYRGGGFLWWWYN